jgi:inorganic pyrophosphatase
VPASIIDRLRHYFLTYKQSPDSSHAPITISHVYGRSEAHDVIRCAMVDYSNFVNTLKKTQPEFEGAL